METPRVHEVVHTLRQKPLHVRQNIALGVSGGLTLVVALGWFAANAAAGTFSLAPTSLASDSGTEARQAVAASGNGFTQLLGAAGAAFGATSSPAQITVVDTKTSSTLDHQEPSPEATVIHF